LTASADGTARLWDAQSGQALIEPIRHSSAINSAHFSPDGQRVLTASADGTARIWDVRPGQALTRMLLKLPDRERTQSAKLLLSPDGQRLVRDTFDGFQICDLATGLPLTNILDTSSSRFFSPFDTSHFTFSPDTHLVAGVWEAGRA